MTCLPVCWHFGLGAPNCNECLNILLSTYAIVHVFYCYCLAFIVMSCDCILNEIFVWTQVVNKLLLVIGPMGPLMMSSQVDCDSWLHKPVVMVCSTDPASWLTLVAHRVWSSSLMWWWLIMTIGPSHLLWWLTLHAHYLVTCRLRPSRLIGICS